jgi:hypothetical protein
MSAAVRCAAVLLAALRLDLVAAEARCLGLVEALRLAKAELVLPADWEHSAAKHLPARSDALAR